MAGERHGRGMLGVNRPLLGVKQSGVWRCPPTPSSVKVKEAELYFYSPSALSWPLIG
jgi:hypothetical protein